ncbi:MAG: bifunctional diguanylate cyclase/phosphodiesterase [Oceanospirillaceae bacterium]
MFADFNIKAILFLIVISLLTFFSHRIGLLDVSLKLTEPQNHHEIVVFSMGDTTAKLEQQKKISTVNCMITGIQEFSLCGLSYRLTEHIRNGVDLSIYDQVALKINFQSPHEKPKLKVSFRNFNEKYANEKDFVSLKFNTITFKPVDYPDQIIVPLSAFQVENWWINQYQVNFANSYRDMSNISSVEIIAQDLPLAGNYKITISELTLHGELISEIHLFKLMLLLWLISAILLVFRQKNIHSRLSFTDTLTGSLNRRGVQKHIERDVLPVNDSSDIHFIYIDIDNFKKVIATFGHVVGDELIVVFANRVCELLSKQHKTQYKLGNLSGGEFAILLSMVNLVEVEKLIELLLKDYQAPVLLGKHKIYLNICIGAVGISNEMTTFESILLRADSAMNYAKNRGNYQYKIFDDNVADEIFFRKSVVEKIKIAIENNDFTLNYMPIVSSHDLVTRHVEVLLRCQSKPMNGIGPDVFIPIAEEYNLIEQIDFWVIEAVFKQINAAQSYISDLALVFCINISAAELRNLDFTNTLHDLLKKYQIDPQFIELEITETSLIEIDDRSIQILEDIKAMGVRLALDDFGTGYTAFNQLINYPVDCLKIDKSFVDYLCSDNSSYIAMVKAIISIAQSYELQTIAEGVETFQQYKLLKELGCDMLQGYHFSKPLPWSDFIIYMKESNHSTLTTKMAQNPLRESK